MTYSYSSVFRINTLTLVCLQFCFIGPLHTMRKWERKRKCSNDKQKRSKSKRQTSKNFFAFASAFSRCKWAFNDEDTDNPWGLVTVRKWSCGKVMFYSYLSFCSQGDVHPPRQTPPGKHSTARHSPGQTPLGTDTPLGRPPTAADGTHPNEKHSCWSLIHWFPFW